MLCLFCNSEGPYSTVEHIISESLGNKHLLLEGQVCDTCHNYLGTKVEEYVLRRSPIGWWRVHAGIKTKNGKPPSFAFAQPAKNKGVFPDRHHRNDDGVEFSISEEGEKNFFIQKSEMLEDVENGRKSDFKLVLTPKMLHMMGRFLGKSGLEMLARDHPDLARSSRFGEVRSFVRYGVPTGFIWPIFHLSLGTRAEIQPAEITIFDTDGLIKEGSAYTLSCLRLGNEVWIICLNDPYPHPVIRKSFPIGVLQLIMY